MVDSDVYQKMNYAERVMEKAASDLQEAGVIVVYAYSLPYDKDGEKGEAGPAPGAW